MTGMRISELAQEAQVPVSTLRYYERIGLIRPATRSANGYRFYDDAATEQLAFIARAKRMGMPLEEIARLIELWSTGGCRPLQERIRSFLDGRMAEVRRQLVDLGVFERQLEELSARLVETDQPEGLRCELNCACVRLEELADAATSRAKVADPCSSDLPSWRLEDVSTRSAQWRELLGGAMRRERLDSGLRVTFASPADSAAALVALCSAEASSYPFLRFTFEVLPDRVALFVEGPGMTGQLIERLLGCGPEHSGR